MDRSQFIAHVERSQGALRRFLTALCCGDAARADDLAQETYVKGWLSCEGFRDSDKFNAWIHRIAYTTFPNSCRSQHHDMPIESVCHIEGDDRADASFRYQALYVALSQLPEKERTSILLYYLEGYSVEEICGITGASAEAVRQHLSRGRRHLRGILT